MMSFLNYSINQFCNNKPLYNKTSLREYPPQRFHKSRKIKYMYSKRISSFLLSTQEGSMTVEASIAIPVFLFAVINLLSVILQFGEYASNLADMHRNVKELAVHAHILGESGNADNELVVLTEIQSLKPVIPVLGFDAAKTIVNCKARKWTGYNVEKTTGVREEEEWVYITPSGSAYHKNPNCGYLNPQIFSAVTDRIDEYRNSSGEKYYPCTGCKDITLTGICFFTEYGNRYHSTLKCSGLKRTVYSVLISEVEGRHACSKCVKPEE